MDPRLGDEARHFVEFVSANFPQVKTFDAKLMRQRNENMHAKINEELIGTFQGREEERQIKVDNTTEIPITIYTPVNVTKDKIVILFHGGGWTVCSRKTHQTIVNMLADATNSVWISVEYRLGPEHKFPIWLDDSYEVTRQILANKSAYGGDENTKVGVAGDSAGGLIAASLCHMIKNLDFQILVYGAFDFCRDTESSREFVKPEHLLTPTSIEWLASSALRDENDRKDPRASVLLRESFENIPPCLFIVAELDPIRDDSYNYQKKLENAGVKTKLVLLKGVLHVYFSYPGIYQKACGETVAAVKEFMDGLDPRLGDEARNYLLFVSQNFPIPKGFDLKAMRERSENINAKVNEKLDGTFQGTEEERQIKIDESTEIPVTIYTPVNVTKNKMVIFFHGGGWTIGSRKSREAIVTMLADATKSVWISVEYRLGPEHKFPVWLDDSCEVTRQILANKTAYGGDENTKVGVAGDSAGGQIAASICHMIKNIDFQIPVYGAFDFCRQTESSKEFTRPEHILTPELLAWFDSNALRDESDKKDPRASVLLQESFENVPPCLFIVAEVDPLRDDSYNYQKKLEKAGIKTNLVLIKSAIHSFFGLPGIYEKACGQAVAAVKEFMDGL